MFIVDRADLVPYDFSGTISSVLGHQKHLIKLKGCHNIKDMKCPYCGRQEYRSRRNQRQRRLRNNQAKKRMRKVRKKIYDLRENRNINLIVIKKDGKREQFDRDKLKKRNNQVFAEKTKVSLEDIEQIVTKLSRN